jgi:single-stranded-DNA-specific exonuclease
MGKKWQVSEKFTEDVAAEKIVEAILHRRGIQTPKECQAFLAPPDPSTFAPKDVGIDQASLESAIARINQAIKKKESIVIYADYDADGITSGAIIWETLWKLGARVMPYIPHRVEEGYGLSKKGIDAVRAQFDPSLIVTVDHGITAAEEVAYAKSFGIDVIVTDHHVKPAKLPQCVIVHTTKLSGAGVSWMVAKELSKDASVGLAAIGTIADLMPLVGINRSIVKFGLESMRQTKRVGLNALIAEAGIQKKDIDTYMVSHVLAPRLNAMGRLEHALDALRLLCTKDGEKAKLLATKLGLTNRERQKLTEDTVLQARSTLPKQLKNLIFIAEKDYNPGVIGLVAGRLVEEYYRPAIVLAIGDGFAKASARSIPGFNIVEAIRTCSDLLVDVGGHPMAAGFTVETKNIEKLKLKMEKLAEKELDEGKLTRVLKIDAEIPLTLVTEKLWKELQKLAPFGFGNYEPVFATREAKIIDARLIGATRKHLKLKVSSEGLRAVLDAVAFNMADMYGQLKSNQFLDLAYSIDMNQWNGNRQLQLKIRDIHALNQK